MIIVENRRKSLKTLDKKYPNAVIFDITSKGKEPYVKFSPFYPHGSIPVPFSENIYATTLEGIWQGLKVFSSEGIDIDKFKIVDMKGIKRSERKYGKVLGHQKGIFSNELLDYASARRQIYLKTYAWILDNIMSPYVQELKEIAFKKDLVLLDYETNLDIDNLKRPLSHAGLVKRYLEKKYPEIQDIKFEISEKKKKTLKSKKVNKEKSQRKGKRSKNEKNISVNDQLELFSYNTKTTKLK